MCTLYAKNRYNFAMFKKIDKIAMWQKKEKLSNLPGYRKQKMYP